MERMDERKRERGSNGTQGRRKEIEGGREARKG